MTKSYWRVIELIKWGEQYFSSKGFDGPRREIEWLLSDLLSLSRVDLYLNFEKTVDPDQLKILKSWIKRRISGEPSPYITGKTEFFGLPLLVDRDVLIPRPETERLVEVALNIAKRIEPIDIIDVGTGSGCISVALAANLKESHILAVDNNDTTLQIAKKNAKLNRVERQISFHKIDILSSDISETFDLLVSNPPYVPKDEIGTLMPEVREFEPMNALTDGEDGLQFYRRFATLGRNWLKTGGFMVLEVGLGSHPEQVKALFKDAGFQSIVLYQDYNGDDRVATIEVND